MSFSPVLKRKLAEQVSEAIRRAIVDGLYAPGDALPSERELAVQFGVNRSSVREALLRLEAWGLVTIRQGESTRVRNVYEVGGIHMLPHLLMPNGEVDVSLLGDILRIRAMFLRWTAEQAAKRPPDDEVEALRQVALALAEASTPADAHALDWDFFEALVRRTGNRALLLFANALRRTYLEHPEQMLPLYADLPFDNQCHLRAVDAIAAGDPAAAGAAMESFALKALGGQDPTLDT